METVNKTPKNNKYKLLKEQREYIFFYYRQVDKIGELYEIQSQNLLRQK